MDILFDTKRLPTENEYQYIWRIGQAKDSGLLGMDWNDIADLINKEFRNDESEYRTEAAYRKSYQQAKKFLKQMYLKHILMKILISKSYDFKNKKSRKKKENYMTKDLI